MAHDPADPGQGEADTDGGLSPAYRSGLVNLARPNHSDFLPGSAFARSDHRVRRDSDQAKWSEWKFFWLTPRQAFDVRLSLSEEARVCWTAS